MFKETPLLSAITVVELFNAANIFSNSHYKYLEPMTLVGLFFLIVSVPAAYAAMRLEQHFKPKNTGAS
jgi:polar amino acid transport system permease protein